MRPVSRKDDPRDSAANPNRYKHSVHVDRQAIRVERSLTIPDDDDDDDDDEWDSEESNAWQDRVEAGLEPEED